MRHVPVTATATAEGDRLLEWQAQREKFADPSSWFTPLLPVTTPETTANPLVQLGKETLDWHQSKVASPSPQLPSPRVAFLIEIDLVY